MIQSAFSFTSMGKERPVDTAFQRLIVSRLKVPCLFPLITVGLSTLTVGGFESVSESIVDIEEFE